MVEPISISTAIAATIMGLVKTAPAWLSPIGDAFLSKGREELANYAFDEGKKGWRSLLHLDEKERIRHLELVLKNAAERSIAQFSTLQERDLYRDILKLLSEEGPHNEALRREALQLFTLDSSPDFAKLAETYQYPKRLSALAQNTTYTDVDVASYLNAFFNALVAELYIDPLFHDKISDVLRLRAARNMQRLQEKQVETTSGMQRSLSEVVATLSRIYQTLEDNYTPEQFEQDVRAYTQHVERTLRYLKLVGVVQKERGNENRDPQLDGIFVPLRIALVGKADLSKKAQHSIVDRLQRSSCMVLLGGPGSGKSTSIRHLAWSHAIANLSDSKTLTDAPLLAGKPLPLRIELRRLNEDRRLRPDYDFLTYASEVLLGRAGLDIPHQMFEVLLERRTMLVLFDGLDEVATIDDRRTLVEEIEAFAQRYPGNRFLVTSRPVGYGLAPLSGQIFSQAEVEPFNDEQIHLFLEHWYAHVLRLSPLSPEDQQELEELYQALKDNPRLHDLAENPLLLTVITALHRYERLPDRRILVYDRCADLLLETWAKLKGTNARWRDLQLSKEDQYACVAHLGFVLHKRAQEKREDKDNKKEGNDGQVAVDVPSRFMLREIEQQLQQQNLFLSNAEQRKQAKRFLELVQEEAGLIVERGTGENNEPLYGFVHRTFQEYFAAADVYERYRQEEDPTIISEFLSENLYDPHWREVILLIFGKLGRKPASKQLRHILEEKTHSRRSKYNSILQQNLFFVSSCLIEEILVDSDLAALIFTKLTSLVVASPYLSQQNDALNELGKLARTRQYGAQACEKLKTIVMQDQIASLSVAIRAASMLFANSVSASEERLIAMHYLQRLVMRADIPIERLVQVVRNLYQSNQITLDKEDFIDHLLYALAQRTDLPLELFISVKYDPRRPTNLFTSRRPILGLRRFNVQLFYALAQRDDLPIELFIPVAHNLFLSGVASLGEDQDQVATQLFYALAQRTDLSIEQLILIAHDLYQCSRVGSDEDLFASELLYTLAQQADPPSELFITAVQHLYKSNSVSPDEDRFASQLLYTLAQRTDLSIEQLILVARNLYQSSRADSHERSFASQLLYTLAQRADLSIEQFVQATHNLYSSSRADSAGSDERSFASQLLYTLAQRTELPVEPFIEIGKNLYLHNSTDSDESSFVSQLLYTLAQRTDLSIEQLVLVARSLYQYSSADSDKVRFAIQSLYSVAQNQEFPPDQRLQAVEIFYTHLVKQYSTRLRAIQITLNILQKEEVANYFAQHWRPAGAKPEISDIPLIAELVREEDLPANVRNEMYRLLNQMIPQFDQISSE